MDAEAATLDASRNRAAIQHVGGVEEWYVNGPLGVEQGFTIAQRPGPKAEASAGPLVLEVDVSGDLFATMHPAAEGVSLVDESGRTVAHYSDLYARDASGKPLEASIAAAGDTISLRVVDEGARYPIEVDPLVWTETTKLEASDAENGAFFGYAVAISSETAVVGAPFHTGLGGTGRGEAYVFDRDPAAPNSWNLVKVLAQSYQNVDGDHFGWSVSVDGDIVAVGAPWEPVGGTNRGAAYIYERDYLGTDNWGLRARVVSSSAQNDEYFGISVAVSGGVTLVGASGNNGTVCGASCGAVYVHERDYPTADAWGELTTLTATVPEAGAAFGWSVALDNGLAVVGALSENGGGSDRGAAYVFERNYPTAGAWGVHGRLTATDAENSDAFGQAVAVDGDSVLVSAPGEDLAGNGAGAAYVFDRNFPSANGWGQRAKLAAEDAAAGDAFGTGVAISGDVVLVGANQEGELGTYAGAAYLFERNTPNANAWGQRLKLTAGDGAANDGFGWAVAMDGDTAVVGATGEDGIGANRGAAYVFALRHEDGDACTEATDCASGYCVDGVCCATECAGGDGDCEACSIAAGGTEDGTCTTRVDGSICDDGVFCNGPETCTSGVCGDSAGDPCVTNVGDADSDCSESCDEAADACSADDLDGSACDDGIYCNGADSCAAGVCTSASTDPCVGPDDDEDCQESCDEAADACTANDPDGSSCAAGSSSCRGGECLGAPGTECTDGAECASSYCVNDVCCTESDCSPYRCGPAGNCGSTCTMSAECATGFHCDGTGRCVADAAPGGSTEDEGGCSCRLGSERRRREGLVSLVGIAAVLGLRRRRRA